MTLIDLQPSTPNAGSLDALPVAIIGAGPIGLAAAANLVERGLPFEIYEAGASSASSVRSWGHISLFSPWKHLIDPAARRLLKADGWREPRYQDTAPTGADLVRLYLEPLAALESVASHLHTDVAVTAVTRQGMDRTRSAGRAETPFSLRTTDRSGTVTDVAARAVIDASGTYLTSNSLASNGLDPVGFQAVAAHVTPALPDVLGSERARFSGKHVTVVGAGHSAVNTLLALWTLIQTEPQTTVTWVIRTASAERVFTSDDDELAGRSALGSKIRTLVDRGVIELVDRFEIVALEPAGDRVSITGQRNGGVEQITTDIVVNATGFRPDLGILREIRLALDDVVEAPVRLAPLIDPNLHSCGTVEPHGFAELQHPEPGFFIAGMKSYGRAPTFLLATGYEQVRSITAHLAWDDDAARAIELQLPATGVCSTASTDSSCCS